MHYRNLLGEMKRHNLSRKQLSHHLGFSEATFANKVNGVTPFKVNEIVKIRESFFPDYSIDYLVGLSDDR